MTKKKIITLKTNRQHWALFNKIKKEMIKQLTTMEYTGNCVADLGNEIGIAVGKHIKDDNISLFQKDDFLSGFNHGFSLMDGTH